jgi:hypothetical protein
MRAPLTEFACLSLAVLHLAGAASAADAPTWSSGDYWRFRNSNSYLELSINGESTCAGTPVYEGWDGGTGVYLRKSDLAFLTINGCNIEADFLDFPMSTGMIYQCSDTTGTFNCRVGQKQSVSTKVGSFDAFEIQVEATAGSFVSFIFFSPDAGYIVKLLDPQGDDFELYSYRYDNGPKSSALIVGAVIILVVVILVIALLAVRAKKKAARRAAMLPLAPEYPGAPECSGGPGAPYSTYGGTGVHGAPTGHGSGAPYPGQAAHPSAHSAPSPFAPGANYGAPSDAVPAGVQPPWSRPAAPATPGPAAPAYTCASCGRTIRYVAAYSRWYCDACGKYL